MFPLLRSLPLYSLVRQTSTNRMPITVLDTCFAGPGDDYAEDCFIKPLSDTVSVISILHASFRASKQIYRVC